MILQYIIIAILFIAALYFVGKALVKPFNKSKKGNCNSNCGCKSNH